MTKWERAMIEFNCEKCGYHYNVDDGFSGKPVRCNNCEHAMIVPLSLDMSFWYLPDVEFKADGLTPDFDDLFDALAKEERTAPPMASY